MVTQRELTQDEIAEEILRQFGIAPEEVNQDKIAERILQQFRIGEPAGPSILPSPVDVSEEELEFGPAPLARGRFRSPPKRPERSLRSRLGHALLTAPVVPTGLTFEQVLKALEPVMFGLDVVGEAGARAATKAALLDPDLQAAFERTGTPRSELLQAAQEAPSPIAAPGELVGSFRERPLAEQIASGAIFDPTAFIPPVGALKVGGRALAAGGRMAREAVPLARPLRTAAAAPRRLTRTELVNLADLRKRLNLPGGLNDRDYALLQRLEARQSAIVTPISPRITMAEQEAARLEKQQQQLNALQAAQELGTARPTFNVGDRALVMGDERIIRAVELGPNGERFYRVEGLNQRVSEKQVSPVVSGTPEPETGAIQAGMGIGERPAQGELGLGGRIAAQEPVPLIDAAQVAERQRLAVERAAGQAGLPEAVRPASAASAGPSGPIVSPEAATPPPGGVPPTPPPSDLPDPRMPPEKDPVIQKALQVLHDVKRVSKKEQAVMFAAERKTRFARGMQASENLPLREGFPRFFSAQAGEFPTPDIQPIVEQFTEDEVNHLFARLEAPGVLRPGYDRNNAAAALADLLHPSTAKIPMPRDLQLLERAFGAKFARELYNKKRTASQAVWDEFIAAWNLPRSLVASLDLSATLRQGAILAPDNLSDWRASVGAELKAFRSESYAAKAWDDIYLHPNYERLVNGGLDLTQRGSIAPLLKREEAFMSRWAGQIPGIRASERAYVTMLNKLRFDVANKMLGQLERMGLSEAEIEKSLAGITDFVNWTTGRGPTIPGGRMGQSLQALLNGVMFSPRFMTSRFATLTLPVTAYQNPAIRQKLAKDLVAWVSVTGMAVGLAKAAGARVETDPRSGEFGKIVLGHTRYDPWAGMQPVARFIAQLIWAQGKTSLGKAFSTDNQDLIAKRQRLKAEGRSKIPDEEFALSGRFLPARLSVLTRFLRSKLQPLAGEAWDQATGEDWLGGEAKPSQALSKDIRVNLFAQNLLPILAQDILDAVIAEESPFAIAGGAAASAVGVGASTYQSPADIAREEFPGLSLEQLRRMPEETQKGWREEAGRRRGVETPSGTGAPSWDPYRYGVPPRKPTSDEIAEEILRSFGIERRPVGAGK